MVVIDHSSLQADSQPKSASEGRWPFCAVVRSPDEPSELSQWPCGHDDSTINIVVVIITILFFLGIKDPDGFGNKWNKIVVETITSGNPQTRRNRVAACR